MGFMPTEVVTASYYYTAATAVLVGPINGGISEWELTLVRDFISLLFVDIYIL